MQTGEIYRVINKFAGFSEFGLARVNDERMKVLRVTLVGFLVAFGLVGFGGFGGSASDADIAIAEAWTLPVSPAELINPYRQPNSDYSAGHRGVDYRVSLGQVVVAPASGRVAFVGKVVNRNLITISHDGGFKTEFEPVCSNLTKGDSVALGGLIGEVCDADVSYRQHCSAARCLHFSMRLGGEYLSPLAVIGGMSPSRLLPD